MKIPFLVHFGATYPVGAGEGDLPLANSTPPHAGSSNKYARADHSHPLQLAEVTPGFQAEVLKKLFQVGADIQGFSKKPDINLVGDIFTLIPLAGTQLVQEGVSTSFSDPVSIQLQAPSEGHSSWVWLDTNQGLVELPVRTQPKGYILVAEIDWGNPVGVPSVKQEFASQVWVDNPGLIQALQDIQGKFYVQANLTKDSIGFPNRTESRLIFDASTRTVTLEAVGDTFSVYFFGKKFSFQSLSLQIADVTGGRYIILDQETLTLVEAGNYPGFATLLVAYVYWDSSSQEFIIQGDERHGVQRDTTWHEAQHLNEGMVWRSGGIPVFTKADPTQVGFGLLGSVHLADEDIQLTVTHSAAPAQPFQQKIEGSGEFPVLHVVGNALYKQSSPGPYPFLHNASGIQYNPIHSETNVGSLASVPDGKFVSYFLMGSNCQKTPIKLIAGRQVWDSAVEAQGESLLAYGLNFPEFVYLYHLVFQKNNSITQNPGKVVLIEVFEPSRPTTSASAGVSANSHNALADRGQVDQHPIEAITGLTEKVTEVGLEEAQTGTSAVVKGWSARRVRQSVKTITDVLTSDLSDLETQVQVHIDDPVHTNSREWIADTVSEEEATEGTATIRRAWTAQRVRQAVLAAGGSGKAWSEL